MAHWGWYWGVENNHIPRTSCFELTSSALKRHATGCLGSSGIAFLKDLIPGAGRMFGIRDD